MKLRTRSAGAFLLLAGVSACDIPTSMPRWETTWITPSEETSVSVVELLPAGLSVNNDTSAFVLTIDPVNDAFALSEFCGGACPPVTATVPKPAFSGTVSTVAPIPAAIQSAEIEGGTIDIELVNGFDFDPLRPGVNADSGSISITIRSGNALVASAMVDGGNQALPPGATLALELDFVPSTLTGDLSVELTLVSPAGDVTTLNPNDALGITIQSDGVLVSEAVVALSGQSIEGVETELDLEDVDLEDRINGGSIFLDIENPFGATGNLSLLFDFPSGADIVKPVALAAGSSTVQVDFTEAEIERLIGETTTMVISGTVNGGNVTIQPDMEIVIGARLRLVVEVGGEADDEGGN